VGDRMCCACVGGNNNRERRKAAIHARTRTYTKKNRPQKLTSTPHASAGCAAFASCRPVRLRMNRLCHTRERELQQ